MRKRITRFGMALAMTICLIAFAVWYDRRPGIALERLLANSPAFPTQWGTGYTRTSGMNWSVAEHFAVQDSVLNVPNALRKWSAGGRQDAHYHIEQLVANYRSPLLASILDRLFPLEKISREEYGNLGSDEFVANRYPTNWSHKSTTADQEEVVCAEGIPDSCDIWLYRARYGQYMVLVEFYTLPRGSNADAFAQIVAQIDTHMSQQLGK